MGSAVSYNSDAFPELTADEWLTLCQINPLIASEIAIMCITLGKNEVVI